MDSLMAAAARALAHGDALGALTRIALRDDAPALALRGIAMAQLGDFARARVLLRRAARAFGPRERVVRARCVVAEAEIALVTRDLGWPMDAFHRARAILAEYGDSQNAIHAANLEARRLLLLGRLDEAEAALASRELAALTPALLAGRELVNAGIAMRRLRMTDATASLERATQAAAESRIASLMAEVAQARFRLEQPVARRVGVPESPPLTLHEVETLLASGDIIVDAARGVIQCHQAAARPTQRQGRTGSGLTTVALASRPVLFTLVRVLAEAWPADVKRDVLIDRAFRGRDADESWRVRLRVEIGRLRAALAPLAQVAATRRGYVLAARDDVKLIVLAPLDETRHGTVLALLADGEAWSSTALAVALGQSARTVQRALEQLAADGRVHPLGRGRARRWVTPSVPGFPTALLLPLPPRRP